MEKPSASFKTALSEWAYARAYYNSDQRSAESPRWIHRYNWRRPHGSLKASTPISCLGLSEDNLLRFHNWPRPPLPLTPIHQAIAFPPPRFSDNE